MASCAVAVIAALVTLDSFLQHFRTVAPAPLFLQHLRAHYGINYTGYLMGSFSWEEHTVEPSTVVRLIPIFCSICAAGA